MSVSNVTCSKICFSVENYGAFSARVVDYWCGARLELVSGYVKAANTIALRHFDAMLFMVAYQGNQNYLNSACSCGTHS